MNKHKDIDKEELIELAYGYCDECIEATREIATVRGAVDVKERHLPTIRYFLNHFLRKKHFEFYKKSNWYDALNDESHPLSDTIKKINELFESLAVDIVANEGKGIFYAKNKLGMSDKVESTNNNMFSGPLSVIVNSTGINIAESEKQVNDTL